MLLLLHIENIAVIEEADIQFDSGFNALTGETGAGKSIVIDAMGAVLGQRTSRDIIRTGAAKAFVSAAFAQVPEDLPALAENGLTAEDGELLLQREIFADGKNACRVNGRPVTVAQLRRVGNSLLNIHGQHDGQQLLDEELHITYLDGFGRLEGEINAYSALYDAMAKTRRQIGELKMDEAEKARRADMLERQIGELEDAQLQPGEEEALAERRNILRNGEKFTNAIGQALSSLNGGDDYGGAVELLEEASRALERLEPFGTQFGALAERLESLRLEADDVAETVRDLERDYDFSPEELDQVEERCDRLYRLKKKYGATVEDMLAYLEKSRQELNAIQTAEDTILLLGRELKGQEKKARAAAEQLSQSRRKAAAALEARILTELRQLDMPKVQFSIQFTEEEMGPGGMDSVRFLMSANVGEALRPIQKVASGGELARIMLALKNVLAENEAVGTMVFDEVDTGVSGRAAQKVAEKLAQVSRSKQVLCVTHLPQLAAMADVHFRVEKGERGGRTYTQVVQLDRAGRMDELARITGGETITEALLAGAGELLDQAAAYKGSLGEERA